MNTGRWNGRGSLAVCAGAVLTVGLVATSVRGEVAGAPAPARAPGDWVLIKAGTFMMGSPVDEPGRDPDEAQHEVTLTHDFLIQSTEVTQGQFEEVMGYNPSKVTDCGTTCPVEQVNWHEAAAYCNRLSEREGLGRCYACNGSDELTCAPTGSPYECAGYRLPTEAEWEYAARAGTPTVRYGNLDEIAWYTGNSGAFIHPARQKRPNGWGLFDMLGNVWEWCHDWYRAHPRSTTDPWGPGTGSRRVGRGGSFDVDARFVRAARRYRDEPGYRGYFLGFRTARSVISR